MARSFIEIHTQYSCESMLKEINDITKELEAEQKRFDEVMLRSSKVIKLAAQLITSLHAKNEKRAKSIKKELEKEVKALSKVEKGFEYYSMQAHQEYVEAIALYNILSKHSIPSKKELNEETAPYILGLMDLVGELKREAIDELRKGNNKLASSYYELMKNIYDSTLHIRFANSILPGFRKKQDVARIQLESLASELLHAEQ